MKRLDKLEARRLLGALDGEARRVVEFLAMTGARVSEALAVRVADVDLMRLVVTVPTIKRKGGRKESRDIRLDEAYAAHLLSGASDDGRLFRITRQGVWKAMKKAAAKAGVDPSRAHPHALRHGFAIANVEAGTPLAVLRAWLGHASYASTLVYTREVEAARFKPAVAV